VTEMVFTRSQIVYSNEPSACSSASFINHGQKHCHNRSGYEEKTTISALLVIVP
jgi:hypothetical protein